MAENSNCLFIDSHVHIMPQDRLRGLARWILGISPDHPVSALVTSDDLLCELRQEGVTHFFNLVYPLTVEEANPLNEFNAHFCNKTPGAIPFAGIHPDTPDKAEFAKRALQSHPFAGFKMHPAVQRFDPWNKCMDPFYAFLQEAGKPLVLHTGFGDFFGRPMPVDKLVKSLKRFPDLCVVFVHMAFPELSTVFSLLDDYPGLYLDGTLVLPMFRPEFQPVLSTMAGGLKAMDVLLENLEKHNDRIMYGSDLPVGGSLHEIYLDLHKLPVSETVKQSICEKTPKAFVSRFLPEFDWSRRLKK